VTLDRLDREDVRILKLETGQVRGHTCKVLVLERSGADPLPALSALREHIAGRLDAAPRLRRPARVDAPRLAAPVWCDDPLFDIDRHVDAADLGRPVRRADLPAVVAQLMTQRLDREHPLWRLDVVTLQDDALALVWRIHHCLADGGTAERMGSAVLWTQRLEDDARRPSPWRPQPSPGTATLAALGLAHRLRAIPHRAPAEGRDAVRRRAARAAIRRELPRARGPRRWTVTPARAAPSPSRARRCAPATTPARPWTGPSRSTTSCWPSSPRACGHG
jgi:diacylglycerol O-acyltransferase / wax synthase